MTAKPLRYGDTRAMVWCDLGVQYDGMYHASSAHLLNLLTLVVSSTVYPTIITPPPYNGV